MFFRRLKIWFGWSSVEKRINFKDWCSRFLTTTVTNMAHWKLRHWKDKPLIEILEKKCEYVTYISSGKLRILKVGVVISWNASRTTSSQWRKISTRESPTGGMTIKTCLLDEINLRTIFFNSSAFFWRMAWFFERTFSRLACLKVIREVSSLRSSDPTETTILLMRFGMAKRTLSRLPSYKRERYSLPRKLKNILRCYFFNMIP